MATLVLRQSKGSPLTNNEVDANFTNLNDELGTKLASASYNAADILTKLKTVDGTTSGLDADLVRGLANSATLPLITDKSSIVTRDSTGNTELNALTLTGALAATSANFSGAVSVGSITIAGGSIPVTAGGTGATNAANARTNLGLVIGTNVQAYTATVNALATLASATDTIAYFTGAGTAATTTYTAYARSLDAAANASAAQTTLGVRVGTDVQPFSSELSAYSAVTTAGLIVRTAANTITSRTITGVTGDIDVVNGSGVGGNPALSVGANIPRLASANTFAAASNTFTNTVYAGTFQLTSDARLKDDIQTLSNALEKVLQLRGVSFTRKGVPEIGLIAQEVEVIVPTVVQESPEGYKTVAYQNMVGLLIEAIKEQNATIRDLTARLEKLEK